MFSSWVLPRRLDRLNRLDRLDRLNRLFRGFVSYFIIPNLHPLPRWEMVLPHHEWELHELP